MAENEAETQTAERNPGDHIAAGMALGCASQIGFIAVSWFLATKFGNTPGGTTTILLSSWGLTQWLAIVPLILSARFKGQPHRLKGLVIIGCLGVLLSSACAGAFFNFSVH